MTEEKKNNSENSDAKEPSRVGVYICYCGGNISDHVDVEAVRDSVAKLPGVAAARTNMFMCSDPGQEMIMKDVRDGTVNRVVVASCAPSLHETTFRQTLTRAGLNPYIYDHANIREHVSWVHHGKAATDKAARLVSAAAAKASLLEPLTPIRVDARPHATVIGGGVAGLRAAADLADKGIAVTLIESSPFLGGRLAHLDTIAPTGEKAADLITKLAARVAGHPAIQVLTCTTVHSFDGYVGNFRLGVESEPPDPSGETDVFAMKPGHYYSFAGFSPQHPPAEKASGTIETGVVVMATGFKPYQPRTGEYGYREHSQVVTLTELIRSLAETQPTGDHLVFQGRTIRSLALIHCVGSRQIPGIHPEDEQGHLNEYCSRTCCTASLHAANTIRRRFSGTRVYELYRDIRTYGRGQENLYDQASRSGVVFLRFEADEGPEVASNEDGGAFPLQVTVNDTLTFGEQVRVPADLVVLATGMEPNAIPDMVEMMKLPTGMDRFLLEVHPKLRPVELSQAGILLAGTCQAPMDVGEACNAASAAAVKAAALLGRGYVELDPFVAEVNPARCMGSGACVEACLVEGALRMTETEMDGQTVKRVEVTPALCTGCGACVAVCEHNAIDVNGWTLGQYEAMVDRIVADDQAA